MKPTVFLNGFFIRPDQARVSIFDRGFCYGDGLFETMRSYHGNIFRLDLHLDRLYSSADLIYLNIPITRYEMSAIINETLRLNGLLDAIVRLTLTRGESLSGIKIIPDAPPTLAILVRPIESLPTHVYEEGVRVKMVSSSASKITGLQLQVKSGNYLARILIREEASKDNCFEAILLDDNDIVTEGTTSNIFIVRNNELLTPQLNEYVLPGITRQVILEIARHKNIPCHEQMLTRQDIYSADEVFLTNTGIEILPVCQADGHLIGNGRPGSVTHNLRKEFLNII